jgi:hypothetical protein
VALKRAFLYSNGAYARLATASSIPLQLGSNDTADVVILDSGNVGIGTNSPQKNVHIKGSSSAYSTLRIETGSDSHGAEIEFADSTDADYGGILQFGSDANEGGRMRFRAGGIETMNLRGGNVGVGTSSPSTLIHAVSSSASPTSFRIENSEGYAQITTDSNVVTFDAEQHLFNNRARTSEYARIDSSGNFLVGTTNTDPTFNRVDGVVISTNDAVLCRSGASWDIGRNSTSGTHITFYTDNGSARVTAGNIASSGSTTSFNTTSDYRLKEDLKDFNALEIASKIKMYDFKWKADDSRSYGVMAHELQEVVPQAVSGDKDAEDMQQVDYSKLVPILLKSIQELEARVEELEKEI